MAHGVALKMRAIQPTFKLCRMENKKSFVCKADTCRARRRNIFFKRLPQGMGNMSRQERATYKAVLNYAAKMAADAKAGAK